MAVTSTLTSGNLALDDARPSLAAPFRPAAARPVPVACAVPRQAFAFSTHAAMRSKPARRAVVRAKALFAAFLCALFIAAALCITTGQEAATRNLIASLTYTQVQVAEGDSLWSIATRYAVDGLTTSQTIALIRQENDLDESALRTGTTLLVPVQG